MNEMELQDQCSRYIQELLPLLRTIHGLQEPASGRCHGGADPPALMITCSTTIREKALLVRLAADLCLVKAAGGNANWGKALLKSLQSTNYPSHQSITISVPGSVHADSGRNVANATVLENDNHCLATQIGVVAGSMVQGNNFRCGRRAGCTRKKGYLRVGIHDRNRYASISALCHVGFSTLSSQLCFHQPPQHAVCKKQGAYTACGRFRALHTTIWRKMYRHAWVIHGSNRRSTQEAATKDAAVADYKTYDKPIISKATDSACDNEESNSHSVIDHVAGHIKGLQEVIPGGNLLVDPASILEETALYILALQMQVHSMAALAFNISTTPTQHLDINSSI